VIVLLGMGLFVADGLKLTSLTGNLIGAASGVAFAIMTLALRKQKNGSPVESIILGNLLAFLIGLPEIVDAPSLPPVGWLALTALGCVQLGVSYWLYARAIRHVTALEAVLIPVIEPLLNPVWVLLVYQEKPSTLALLGGALVLSAVTWRGLSTLRDRGRGTATP
jgi:drug/metabolite transporter (DMT)-like permease